MIKKTFTAGFTLIEMLVSMAVFSIIITITVGALLMLIAGNSALQAEQSVMTNLSFLMDNMTREIRTGTGYYCGEHISPFVGNTSSGVRRMFNNVDSILPSETQDCEDGSGNNYTPHQGIAFVETGGSIGSNYGGASRISYFFDPVEHTIMRNVGNNPPEPIVSSGIHIERAEFFVTGTNDAYNDNNFIQPTVTIFIEAKEKAADANSFFLQTTVTQRRLDL